MAVKRPLDTVDLTGNKTAKIAVHGEAVEIHKSWDLLEHQLQQKRAELEARQKQKAAEAEQGRVELSEYREAIIECREAKAKYGEAEAAHAKITELEALLANENVQFAAERFRHERTETVLVEKLAKIESKHAEMTRDLGARLTKAKESIEGGQDKDKTIAGLKSSLEAERARNTGLDVHRARQARASFDSIQTLKNTLASQESKAHRELNERKNLNRANEALSKERDIFKVSAADLQKRVAAMTKAADENSYMRNVLKTHGVSNLKEAGVLVSMTRALESAVKVKDAAKGLQLGAFGEFGEALKEMRETLSAKVINLLPKKHTPATGSAYQGTSG